MESDFKPELSFRDSEGRTWLVPNPIDWPTVHRVKQLAGIDLLSIARGVRPLPATDPPRTRLALYAVVKPYADHGAVTRDEFTAAVFDPAVEAIAVGVVMQALADQAPPELAAELAAEFVAAIAVPEIDEAPAAEPPAEDAP